VGFLKGSAYSQVIEFNLTEAKTDMAEIIAIVGSACSSPGSVSSSSKPWDLLKAPRDVIRDFPRERLNFSNFYSQDGEQHGRTDV
jgi:acyl transferase domain-containing protein